MLKNKIVNDELVDVVRNIYPIWGTWKYVELTGLTRGQIAGIAIN
jgi:hypothetical protein